MSVRCLLGFHTPSIVSIATRRAGGYRAICEHCARPLERGQHGGWTASAPLDERHDQAT